ncbi:MAG: heme ABC transporter ATP-binding protein [Pseudomonadota bacterium]
MFEAVEIDVALGRQPVLRQVSLRLEPGKVTALIGPNGAGKSTLLACLSGALRPRAGRVRIDGDDPATLSAAELGRRRAVLEQTPSASAPFALEELIELGIPRAVPPAATRQIIHRAMAALDLSRFQGRPITALSGGERHRAHMARTLAQLWAGQALGAGRWLLLDEPTASLDLAHQGAVLRAARAVAADGVGVLAVLHDLTLAAAMADRIALMQTGSIVALGPPEEVLAPATLSPVYGVDLAVTEAAGAVAVLPLFNATEGASRCSSP